MSTARFRRLRALFDTAVELEPDDRGAFLDAECGDDAELRDELASLLRSDASGADTIGAAVGAAATELVTASDRSLPQQIDQYRILRKIGEGGMGVVYEAEQQQPKRRVAVKVIRGGQFVDEATIRMFRREAQSLAMLEHPSIAAIHESGQTDDGCHFFAMELIEGEMLTDWLRGRGSARLTHAEVRLRLQVFRHICEAVSYAHQRGVVHRDLKPSNILVKPSDGSTPGIKVLDFGLAKITTDNATMLTAPGHVQGTLPYMSPEQVRGDPRNIDLRTDIYSLGVLLFEMLTQQLPIETETLSRLDAARVICEERPTRLATAWPGPGKPDRDLETIVAKALEKEPARRYASAASLADDIDRFDSGQPILARPPSTTYQLRKLVARHKLSVTALAIFALLLIVFAIAMAWQADRAARARDLADAKAKTADEVADFLVKMFGSMAPGDGSETLRAGTALDRASKELTDGLQHDPAVRARLLHVVGWIYGALGRFGDGEQATRRALELRRTLLGDRHADVAEAMVQLGAMRQHQGDTEEASVLLRDAQAILAETPEPDAALVARATEYYASLLYAQGKYEEAAGAWRRVIELRERALGSDHQDVGRALRALAVTDIALGRLEESEALLQRTQTIFERTYGPNHPQYGELCERFGRLYDLQDKPAEAEQSFRRARDIYVETLPAGHPAMLGITEALGDSLAKLGRFADAEPLLIGALRLYEEKFGNEDPRIASCLISLAAFYMLQGQFDTALDYQERAVTVARSGRDGASLGQALSQLGSLYLKTQQPDRAEVAWREAQAVAGGMFPADHPVQVGLLEKLGSLHVQRREFDAAATCYRDALARHDRARGRDDPGALDRLLRIAEVEENAGHRAAALACCREALERGFPPARVSGSPVAARFGEDGEFAALIAEFRNGNDG